MKILSALTFLSATLTVYFEYSDRRLVYFFKPLTLIFIISIVWFYAAAATGFYRRAILAGLFFSLAGDTLLINPQNFVFGLASFLAAHLCYIAAFARAAAAREERFNPLSLSAFAVGGGMLWLVYGGVPGHLKLAVVFYALAISAMLGAAVNFYLAKKTPEALFALSGAFLFVASDSALAYNKFKGEFFLAKLVILGTYFLAQWLIARSTAAAA